VFTLTFCLIADLEGAVVVPKTPASGLRLGHRSLVAAKHFRNLQFPQPFNSRVVPELA